MKTEGAHSIKVRKPAFAGSFYPASKSMLVKELEMLFAGVAAPGSARLPRALIVPHAGYMFSGQVAASAYSQVPENAAFKRVVVLASSHHCSFPGASVCNVDYYKTPLGKIKVDKQVTQKLIAQNSLFDYRAEAHTYEHSLEVQLPFLQYRLGNDFMLVPVVLGTHDVWECEQIARLLEPWFTPENLFVVSTDFSHYPAYEHAVENDSYTARAICSNRPEALAEILASEKKIRNLATSLCGWTSVLTLMYLTRNQKVSYSKIQYMNSGDAPTYGNREGVVGYWAIAVNQTENELLVPDYLQLQMLETARKAIVHFIEGGKPVHPRLPHELETKSGGMFVSIYVKQQLRGCIGHFNEGDSLNETLEQLAVSACCDHRFEDLKKDELNDMVLEISVLSPLRRINSIDEIELGKHGIYIKKGEHSGTFLPKVAAKTGWSVNELLGVCASQKAGIGWNGWKDAEIYVYEAFEFSENQSGAAARGF